MKPAQAPVVLIDLANIVGRLPAAYDHLVFNTAAYAVFRAGPSAAGGVLIQCAKRDRALAVVPQPSPLADKGDLFAEQP